VTDRAVCTLCGRKLPVAVRVFSRHTRAYYCRDIGACERRQRKAAAARR
jgi:hypothetical protein